MENLNTILKKIQKHYLLEKEHKVRNMAIGRGCVSLVNKKTNRKEIEKQVWITNRTYNRTSNAKYDITGVINSMQATNIVDTLINDGATTSKNTQWGRTLLENYKGTFTIKVPTGTIEFTIINSSTYTPYLKDITDLKVGISGNKRYLNFRTITQALKELKTNIDFLDKHKEIEDESKKREENLIKELENKKKQHEEEIKKASDFEQKKKLEEKLREEEEERLKKIHLEQERQQQIEKERIDYENHLNSITEKYHDALKFIRTQASLRLNPVLDKKQNDAKFDHVYDGTTVIINGGPGTGKTTTLIQRIKFLIEEDDLKDYRLNKKDCKLTDSDISFVSSEKDNWLFFSPSELLKTYLKENMNYEGLYDTGNVFVWKDFLRLALSNNYQITGKDKPFDYKSNKFKDESLIKDNEIHVIKTFTKYYITTIKKNLYSISQIDCSKFRWNAIGSMIKDICKTAENIYDIQSLCKMILKLSDLQNQKMPEGYLDVNTIRNEFIEKIQNISTRYLSQWNKDKELYNKLLDLVSSWIDKDTEEDDDEFEEEIPTKNLEIKLNRYTKNLFKKIALNRIDSNIKVKGRLLELYNIVHFDEEELNTTEINKIGELAYFNLYFNPIVGNYESTIFSKIPNIYKNFRKEALKGGFPEWNIYMLRDIVETNKNRLIHPQEQSFLIGFINNLVISLYKISPLKFKNLKHKFAVAYKNLCKPVIGVDEATDYCLMDYYAIASLRHYKLFSFTLTGDIMQCFKTNGITDWNLLINENIFASIDIKELNVSYRQSIELLNLAKSLYKHSIGKDASYECFLKDEKNTPKPLWYESNEEDDKVEWICERILEVKQAYGEIPSIAIFVKDDDEAYKLMKSIEKLEILDDEGIKIKDCSSQDISNDKTFVRIFPLDLVKGMEFEVVFFHNIDMIKNPLIDKYLYVGLSRATFYMGVTSSVRESSDLLNLKEHFKENGNWMDIQTE